MSRNREFLMALDEAEDLLTAIDAVIRTREHDGKRVAGLRHIHGQVLDNLALLSGVKPWRWGRAVSGAAYAGRRQR